MIESVPYQGTRHVCYNSSYNKHYMHSWNNDCITCVKRLQSQHGGYCTIIEQSNRLQKALIPIHSPYNPKRYEPLVTLFDQTKWYTHLQALTLTPTHHSHSPLYPSNHTHINTYTINWTREHFITTISASKQSLITDIYQIWTPYYHLFRQLSFVIV